MRTPPPPDPPGFAQPRRGLDWFVRRRDTGWDAAQEQVFQTWLAADAAHRQAWERWQGEWLAFDAIPQDMRSLLQRNLAYDQAMDAASSAGAARAQAAAPGQALPMPSRRHVLAPALAVAAIAVTGGAGLLGFRHWQAEPVFVQAFSTQRGQQAEVSLPDGSRLRLDTATRIEVRYYRQYREVKLLDGQAVFAVHADPQQPFHVLAGPLRVTVVGTRFSVRHTPLLPGSAGVHVAVDEGKVRVERMAGDAAPAALATDGAVFLTAHQQISSDGAGLLSAVSPVAAVGIAPWRDHRVSFDNQRLDHALAELARYGEPQLLVRDPAVAALTITGVFDPRDMATFRRVLPASLPVRLQATPGGVAEVVLAR